VYFRLYGKTSGTFFSLLLLGSYLRGRRQKKRSDREWFLPRFGRLKKLPKKVELVLAAMELLKVDRYNALNGGHIIFFILAETKEDILGWWMNLIEKQKFN